MRMIVLGAEAMKTERMTILLTPAEKAAIASRAKKFNLSPPGNSEAVLNDLADELHRAAREARAALTEALSELERTLRYFSSKRRKRR